MRLSSRRPVRHLPVMTLLALAACAQGGPGGQGTGGSSAAPRNVAVLLPLSGSNAGLGNEMLSAARLAFARPASPATGAAANSLPQIDARDTAAAGGADAAIRAAVAAGDGIVLGPLTSADTASVAPVANAAGVPVIAFTSDVAQARPGVWVFGITPQQQVNRLVAAAKAEGRRQFAAFLPDDPLGHALGDALVRTCQEMGMDVPIVAYHTQGADAIKTGLASLSAYDSRLASATGQGAEAAGALPPDLAAALARPPTPTTAVNAPAVLDGVNDQTAATHSPSAPPAAAAPSAPPVLSAPPFDALLLGDTGLPLKTVIDNLHAMQVNAAQVRLMGPGLWAAFAGKLGAIAGAWYAAPDPAGRQSFVRDFAVQTHRAPKPLGDLAYDAALLARQVATESGGGYPVDLLTRSQGFSGVDGVFALHPDGRTTRELAIFEIQPGGGTRILGQVPRPVTAAPKPAAPTGST